MVCRNLCVIITLVVSFSSTLKAQQVSAAPEWFPLSAEQDKYLQQVLKYWEFQAAKVQRYRCKFTRWEYDPITLPRNPDIAASIAQGNIQFAAPDKGLFKVEKLNQIVIQQQGNISVPSMKDGKPEYTPATEILGEHWICDGTSIFEFDSRNKQLKKRALPPDMQGKQISEGPLPFLFGAKAESIMQRYWIRVISPPPKENHFWLEAIPKRRDEAADFRAIHVVIDDKEWLPTAIILDETAGGRATYEFSSREKNWLMLPAAMNPFQQQFFAPKPPAGWKLVEIPFRADPAPVGPQPAGPMPAGPVTRSPMVFPTPRNAQGTPMSTPNRR